ncbi:DUF29 domain-containing protein [uncultured Sphingomonas sp.]|uniref:DUF29 domain-containing protein n=1 Tax=uncultured Sphingomonas sp. TaxID=158754 RepID=UPI0035CB7D3D
MATQLYETDFYGWTQEQAVKLRALLVERSNLDLDIENILEEIDSLGRSDHHQLISRFEEIAIHLLKLHYSTILECENTWKNSVRGQRGRIARLLRRSPSLKPRLGEALSEGYEDALRHFSNEKLIELCMPEHLPGSSPFGVEECLTDEWWPELRGRN